MGKSCFVIMPIGDQRFISGNLTADELRLRYTDLIKEALLKARPDLEVVRADEVASLGGITSDILTRLMQSDYVLADITYPNPNVYYELGIRHACRPGTILIRDVEGPQAPFDLADLRHITYVNTTTGLKKLAENLKKQLDWIDAHSGHPDNRFMELAKQSRYQYPIFNRPTYPSVIENVIKEQLLSLNFYKQNVLFAIEIAGMTDREIEFVTELSYLVINRTAERHNWHMQYKFKYGIGEAVELRFNDKVIDAEMPDFRNARGVDIPRALLPGETASVFFRMRERFRIQDSELYTSYHPATDLKVIINNPFKNVRFDFESFYFNIVIPNRRGNQTEVYFDNGLLPHQGLKLNWKGE